MRPRICSGAAFLLLEKVVSAEGIESARKRIYNKMQAADVIRSGAKSALD